MRPLFAILLSAACGLALAQATMYRSTMPDGKKIISERPMPGAAKVEELKVSKGNYAPGDPAARAAPATGDRGAALDKAQQELREARKSYDAALAAAEKGKEEEPGDRQGTAKGGSRFTGAYEARQASLKQQVDAARKRVEEAQRKVNDLR